MKKIRIILGASSYYCPAPNSTSYFSCVSKHLVSPLDQDVQDGTVVVPSAGAPSGHEVLVVGELADTCSHTNRHMLSIICLQYMQLHRSIKNLFILSVLIVPANYIHLM